VEPGVHEGSLCLSKSSSDPNMSGVE
jgi:hypothetical protein